MEVLSISSPVSAPILSVKSISSRSKPFFQSFKPQIFTPSHSLSLKTSLNPRQTTASAASGHGFELPQIYDSISSSTGTQAQNDAMARAALDPMGLLLKERIVFLGTEIDDFIADGIISQLLLLDAQDPNRDIRLFINSPGGSVSATMAIYDVIQLVRADVSTVALGIAASTSAIILGGGAKGKRLAMPNTRIMVHQPFGSVSGKSTNVEVQAKEVMNTKKHVIRIMSGFTGRPSEEIEQFIDRDRYMSPIEAIEYGFLDGVIDRDSIIPLEPVPKLERPREYWETTFPGPRPIEKPDIPEDELN